MITIQLEDDEALVLFEFLARSEDVDIGSPITELRSEDRAEVLALWALHGALQRILAEPFGKDYEALVSAARTSVRARRGEQ